MEWFDKIQLNCILLGRQSRRITHVTLRYNDLRGYCKLKYGQTNIEDTDIILLCQRNNCKDNNDSYSYYQYK